MIPQRVKLQGFLCYKDEQEVHFDGAALWILSGLNGSGKSSVFDAVTYALFGFHRGGSRDAHELINKDCDGLSVEFDFQLDGQLCRARRTLRRNARGGATGTQQILCQQAGKASWAPVEGTSQKREFDAWVRDHIGLDYETFTSSVLLLQGKAEKLLDSTAKGRFEVLAGVVDLGRYERLHKRADEERKRLNDEVNKLRGKVASVPPVDPAEWAQLEECVVTREMARRQAEAEVERLHALEFQARRWAELQARLAAARQRRQQAESLLADAPAIERDLKRLGELRDALPRVQTIVEQRQQARNAEEKSKQLGGLKQKLTTQLDQQDHALEQTRQKRASLQTTVTADEQRLRDVAGQLRQATELVTRVQEHDRQESDLQRLQAELARLPADPAGAVAKSRELCERLTTLTAAVPILERIEGRREELRETVAEERAARVALQQIQRRGEKLAADVKEQKPKLEEATRTRQQADERAAEARALAQQARQGVQDFNQLEGARTCRQCGQPLTADHFKEELRRREEEVKTLSARLQQATTAQQAAHQQEQQLRDQHARAEKEHLAARDEYRDQKNLAEQRKQSVERLGRDLNQTYGELPLPFRQRVGERLPADWLATVYPSAEELDAARREVSGLSAARRLLREQEEVNQQWKDLKSKETVTKETLARLRGELPADRQSVRQEHSRLDAEQQALEHGLAAKRAEALDAQKELDRLTREREQLQQQLAEVNGKLQAEETTRLHSEQTTARLRKELPRAWQAEADRAGMSEIFTWKKEVDDFTQADAEGRGQRLQQARQGLELLRQDVETLEQQQDTFPDETRQDPTAVQLLLQGAKRDKVGRDEELNQALQLKAQLQHRREQRSQFESDSLAAEQEYTYYETLAKLLGRDRLQLHLVRQAERQVVDHANAVLDRLSGGQLYLRLCGEADGDAATTKALELEAYNRSTGDRPFNVAMLSGSQKFRIAVSLALGIGQYASRQHRPIESVIIDEGFGCLDRPGRQEMIQELHNLRGHLKCILLVSHQEEFAEAFADGYHFELDGGATRVKRLQR